MNKNREESDETKRKIVQLEDLLDQSKRETDSAKDDAKKHKDKLSAQELQQKLKERLLKDVQDKMGEISKENEDLKKTVKKKKVIHEEEITELNDQHDEVVRKTKRKNDEEVRSVKSSHTNKV